MEKRTLGRTGLQVTALGFGGAEIGYERAAPEVVASLLNAALDAGLNVIDTAECYFDSEELIGRAVAGRRGDFLLFTKCGHAMGFDAPDWDPGMLVRSIDRSLKRLRTDHVDLLQLHSCSLELLRRGDVIAVVQAARDAGKVRFVGYSGDGPAAKYAVECGLFDALQTSVNIADQEAIDQTLPLARERNVGVIAKRPIANAAWRHPTRPDNSYLEPYWERLRELDYPFLRGDPGAAVDLALRFTLRAPGVATAIVGTKNPSRWHENAALAARGPLAESDYRTIRARWAEAARPEWVGQT
jgi:aryl-alcohol dehydrogenase-like predicted oxidoreductase